MVDGQNPTPDMLRALAERLGIYEIVYGEREPDMCNRPAMEIVRVNGKAHRLDWLLTWEGAGAVLEAMGEMWAQATECPPGRTDVEHERWMRTEFVPPFDHAVFFDRLHRDADRRWPYTVLFLQPESIIRAACRALGVEHDG